MIYLGQTETIKYTQTVEAPKILPTPAFNYENGEYLGDVVRLIAENMPVNAVLYVNGVAQPDNYYDMQLADISNCTATYSVQYKKDEYPDSDVATIVYNMKFDVPVVLPAGEFSNSSITVTASANNGLTPTIQVTHGNSSSTIQSGSSITISNTQDGDTDYTFTIQGNTLFAQSDAATYTYHVRPSEMCEAPTISVSNEGVATITPATQPQHYDGTFSIKYKIGTNGTEHTYSTPVQLSSNDTIYAWTESSAGWGDSSSVSYTYTASVPDYTIPTGIVTGYIDNGSFVEQSFNIDMDGNVDCALYFVDANGNPAQNGYTESGGVKTPIYEYRVSAIKDRQNIGFPTPSQIDTVTINGLNVTVTLIDLSQYRIEENYGVYTTLGSGIDEQTFGPFTMYIANALEYNIEVTPTVIVDQMGQLTITETATGDDLSHSEFISITSSDDNILSIDASDVTNNGFMYGRLGEGSVTLTIVMQGGAPYDGTYEVGVECYDNRYQVEPTEIDITTQAEGTGLIILDRVAGQYETHNTNLSVTPNDQSVLTIDASDVTNNGFVAVPLQEGTVQLDITDTVTGASGTSGIISVIKTTPSYGIEITPTAMAQYEGQQLTITETFTGDDLSHSEFISITSSDDNILSIDASDVANNGFLATMMGEGSVTLTIVIQGGAPYDGTYEVHVECYEHRYSVTPNEIDLRNDASGVQLNIIDNVTGQDETYNTNLTVTSQDTSVLTIDDSDVSGQGFIAVPLQDAGVQLDITNTVTGASGNSNMIFISDNGGGV